MHQSSSGLKQFKSSSIWSSAPEIPRPLRSPCFSMAETFCFFECISLFKSASSELMVLNWLKYKVTPMKWLLWAKDEIFPSKGRSYQKSPFSDPSRNTSWQGCFKLHDFLDTSSSFLLLVDTTKHRLTEGFGSMRRDTRGM